MDEVICLACGKCCRKHWLVKLTNDREKKMFEDDLVSGEFIWTDLCKFLGTDGKCKNHGDEQPYKCKEYFCEGRELDNNEQT